jgi:hypothetical protein
MIVNKVRAVVGRWAGGEPGRYAPESTVHGVFNVQ